MEAIRELAEQLPIDASTNSKDITPSVSPAVAREFWQRRNKVANFLKHADRDASSLIALDEVDNFRLIMHTSSAYVDVSNFNDLEAEGLVLMIYSRVVSGDTEGLHPKFQDIAAKLEPLATSERLELCSAAIRIMNERP